MSDQHDDDQRDDGGLGDILGNLLGGGGEDGGLGGLFAQAQQAMAASQAASEAEVEGTAGGGAVKIRSTGGGEVLAVTISPAVVDPTDIETLEDLVVAAFRDVHAKIGALHQQAMGGLGAGMLGGGADIEGLAGLLGGDVIDSDATEAD